MKIIFPTFTVLFVFIFATTLSAFTAGEDTVADQPCISNVFYAPVGTSIHKVEFNNGVVTDLGIFAPSSFSSLYSVAYGEDITGNSTNRTIYSSKGSPNEIVKWNGAAWVTVVQDSLVYHNGDGYGKFIYFQHVSVGQAVNDQCISKLNANGSLTKIFTDTSLVFSASDIAVDSSGNIYFFRGTAIGNTTELTVISPSGTILNSYPVTNVGTMTTMYGLMFLNGSLFLGQGTTFGNLFPVIFNGTTVSLGTFIPTPSSVSYKDLAGCHDVLITGFHELPGSDKVNIYPVPASVQLTIDHHLTGNVEGMISDIQGKTLKQVVHLQSGETIDISFLPPGIYFLHLKNDNGSNIFTRFIRQ